MIFKRLRNPYIFIYFVFISELDVQFKSFNFCKRLWESIMKYSQDLTHGLLNKNSISKHNLEIMFPL